MRTVKRAQRIISEWEKSFTSVRLYWDGRELFLSERGEVVSVSQQGQGVLQLSSLPIELWYEQATTLAEVIDLREFRRSRLARRAIALEREDRAMEGLASGGRRS